ncbi:helix-turn-helix domain-containing protein [Acidisphaera sp. L21]|uniref:helix-turn-helix domain-containing protein n=1 Tax=Acidisphaera sp. L21 TaxID=1641851 RepID=UPI00131D3AEB|nr:helix-turn-helix transcriptional regulator [Acidisphaera sp. L21]
MDRSIGERIAAWRRDRGMSQAALATATGVSRSAVAQWETDRAGQVSGNLSRIARALDVSVEALLHGSDGLTGDELAVLRLYRACAADGRAEVLRLARRLARDVGEPEVGPGV